MFQEGQNLKRRRTTKITIRTTDYMCMYFEVCGNIPGLALAAMGAVLNPAGAAVFVVVAAADAAAAAVVVRRCCETGNAPVGCRKEKERGKQPVLGVRCKRGQAFEDHTAVGE